MRLKFDDRIIDVCPNEEEVSTSRSTGKQLSTYSISINIRGTAKLDEFKKLVEKYQKECLNELDSSDIVIRKFLINNSSYSYTGTVSDENTIYHYTIRIRECEELHASVLTIAGVDCEVIQYDETIDESTGAIIIDAIIKQPESDRAKILANVAKNNYFDVIRKGISEDVVKMRFGKVIWSKHDDYIKRKIILVEEKYDDGDLKSTRNILGINEPELSNMMKLLALQMKYSTLLEELLINKGIVSSDEIANIKIQSGDTYLESTRDYYLVDDVESYD